jgi:hypothetical protein
MVGKFRHMGSNPTFSAELGGDRAAACGKCSTAAVVMMDDCMTCLNCGDSKCRQERGGFEPSQPGRVHACTRRTAIYPGTRRRSAASSCEWHACHSPLDKHALEGIDQSTA